MWSIIKKIRRPVPAEPSEKPADSRAAVRLWLEREEASLLTAIDSLACLMKDPVLGGPGFLTVQLPQSAGEAVTVTCQYPNISEVLCRAACRGADHRSVATVTPSSPSPYTPGRYSSAAPPAGAGQRSCWRQGFRRTCWTGACGGRRRAGPLSFLPWTPLWSAGSWPRGWPSSIAGTRSFGAWRRNCPAAARASLSAPWQGIFC